MYYVHAESGCKSQGVMGRWDRMTEKMQGQSSKLEEDQVYTCHMEDSSQQFSVAAAPNHNMWT